MAEYQDDSVGAIWKKLKKDGDVYLSIKLNGEDYVAWKVKDRRSDKSPHFKIFPSRPVKPKQTNGPDPDPLDNMPF